MAKWSIRLLIGIAAILVLLTLSCSMDLDPAKAGTTSVSFVIGTGNPQSPGRAVAPGLGYLYIRTIGGPVGDKGPLYGPFPLASGSAFTTKDIPAGTYSSFGIIYATRPLEDRTANWNGSSRTFTELMRLPDEEFILFTDEGGESEEPSGFELLVDGFVSGELVQNVIIKKDKVNQLALTLVPVCGDSRVAFSATPGAIVYTEAGNPDALIRKYVKLEGIVVPTGYTLSNVVCTILARDGMYLGSAALYDEDGILIGANQQINGIPNADTNISRPWNGEDSCYLYVEYRGAELAVSLSGEMTVVEPPVVDPPVVDPPVVDPPVEDTPEEISLSVSAGSIHSGQNLIAAIYPGAPGVNDEGEPAAVAVIPLDSNGAGSGGFVNPGTTAVHSFGAGTWTIRGFIPIDDNFADIQSGTDLASIAGIEPDIGYYVCTVTVTTDGLTDAVFTLTGSSFTVSDTYVFYVSQNGDGTRDGRRTGNAMGVFEFRDMLTGSSDRAVRAYVLDQIEFDESTIWTVANSDQVDLSSLLPDQPQTLLSAQPSALRIDTGGSLRLSNIVLDGNNAPFYSPLLQVVGGKLTLGNGARVQNRDNGEASGGGIRVGEGATLIMEEGSYISNCTSGNGGAVFLTSTNISAPAVFQMNGGTITGCVAGQGGAISANYSVQVTLEDGLIENCDADNRGGAVYITGDPGWTASLALSGTEIRGCSAADGGAVYAEVNTTITMDGGLIDNCTATGGIGGGIVIMADTGATVAFTMSGGTISNCQAGSTGGGIYIYGMYGSMTMSGGVIDTCNSANGGCIAVESGAQLELELDALLRNTNPGLTTFGWAIYCTTGTTVIPNPSVDLPALLEFIENGDEDAVYVLGT